MLSRFVRALALCWAWPCAALAQSAPPSSLPADSVVITATRSPIAASANIRPLTVITREDLQLSGVGSLAEVLRTFGGAEMSSNGGAGQVSGVLLRGANSDQTVVLVDGVRIGSATSGTAALEAIPLALIDRIEVLPGPASSLYGSDAIGGVIQIFTRDGSGPRSVSVATTAGSHGLRQLAASYSGPLGESTTLALGLEGMQTQGINATTPDNPYSYNPDRDGLRQRGAHWRLSQRLSPDDRLNFGGLETRNRVHYDDGPDFPGHSDTFSDTVNQTLSLDWTHAPADGSRSELRLARSEDRSDDHSSYPGFFHTRQDQASWLGHFGLAGGTASLGLEALRQRVESSVAYTVAERNIRSGMLGWRGQWGPQSLQVDLRQDRNSQFGDHNTGQAAWAYQVDPSLRWRAGWGTAFHAPSFNFLYYPGFSNPNLQPERSRNLELGADWRVPGWALSATAFDNRIRDLIDSPPPDYLPENIGRARITGLTVAADVELSANTRAKLSLTAQNPRDDVTGDRLRRRARLFGTLHLSHRFGAWQGGGDWSRVGQRFDSSNESPDSRMGGFNLLALFAAWQISPQWALEGRVNNATDRRYQTAQGYAVAGREGQITLRWEPSW